MEPSLRISAEGAQISFIEPRPSIEELWTRIQSLFHLTIGEDQSPQEACFQAVYETCLTGAWKQIAPLKNHLHLLTDSLGHTVLQRAFDEGRMDVVKQLMVAPEARPSTPPSGGVPEAGELLMPHVKGKLVINPDNSVWLDIQMTKEEWTRYYKMQLDLAEGTPTLQLQLAKDLPLPPAIALRYQQQAIEALITTAEEDISKVSEATSEAKKALEGERTKVKRELQKCTISWGQKISRYYDLSRELWWLRFPLVNCVASDLPKIHKDLEKYLNETSTLFQELRELNPDSMFPFYPLLTILASQSPEESLRYIMREAKSCNPHLTYALTLHFIRLTTSFPEHAFSEGTNPQKVIELLGELYPEDLYIPVFLQALKSGSTSAEFPLPAIANSVEASLIALASGEVRYAINLLTQQLPYLPGFSFLYRYLILAWSLHGSPAQAEKIKTNITSLGDIHDRWPPRSVMDIIIKVLDKIIPAEDASAPKSKKKQSSSPITGVLESCLHMINTTPFDLGLAITFIDKATKSLHDSPGELPFIYFGIQNIISKLVVIIDRPYEWYNPFILSLSELMSVAAYHCHCIGNLDPWLAENFQKEQQEDEYHFLVNMSSYSTDLELPLFRYTPGLELTLESQKSLLTQITKQTNLLILGLFGAEAVLDFLLEKPDLRVSDHPTLFTNILHAGLTQTAGKDSKNEILHHSAIAHLRDYLAQKPIDRPFAISPDLLEWAKFAVFAAKPNQALPSSCMKKEILDSYYPPDFSGDALSSACKTAKKTLPGFTVGTQPQWNLSRRDVLLADHRIRMRSSEANPAIEKNNSLYALFGISQHLFGWRKEESFAAWGGRLEKAMLSSPGASDFNIFAHKNLDFASTFPNNCDITDYLGTRVRGVLRLFLQFWGEFHTKTQNKNTFIANGGAEDTTKVLSRVWGRGLTTENWMTIIKNNTPKAYPEFNKLSKTHQQELIILVGEKHEFLLGAPILKAQCKPPGTISSDECKQSLAAMLVANVEYSRKTGACHSIYMASETQALELYQLLLEISVERMVRGSLVQAGVDGWKETDLEKIQGILWTDLQRLTGKFHGPETHILGSGPTASHYNAHITKSNLELINTHIYW